MFCGMWRAFAKGKCMADRGQAKKVEVVVDWRMWVKMMMPASCVVVVVRDLGRVKCRWKSWVSSCAQHEVYQLVSGIGWARNQKLVVIYA